MKIYIDLTKTFNEQKTYQQTSNNNRFKRATNDINIYKAYNI